MRCVQAHSFGARGRCYDTSWRHQRMEQRRLSADSSSVWTRSRSFLWSYAMFEKMETLQRTFPQKLGPMDSWILAVSWIRRKKQTSNFWDTLDLMWLYFVYSCLCPNDLLCGEHLWLETDILIPPHPLINSNLRSQGVDYVSHINVALSFHEDGRYFHLCSFYNYPTMIPSTYVHELSPRRDSLSVYSRVTILSSVPLPHPGVVCGHRNSWASTSRWKKWHTHTHKNMS